MELQYRGNGKVYYKDKEYPCILYLNEKEGGIVLVIKNNNGTGLGDFLELSLEMPFLSGVLESGFKFTLISVKRIGTRDLISYGITEYTYDAEYILCGIGERNQQPQSFYKVCYTLSDIVEWGEYSIYDIDKDGRITSKVETEKRTLFEGTKYSIKYSIIGSLLPTVHHELLKESIELKQSGVIEIEFSCEVSFESFNEVFNQLKSLIEIALFRKINVEKIVAYSHKLDYQIGDAVFEQSIEIHGAAIKQQSEVPHSISWKWITLSEFINHNSFEHFINKYEKLVPIVELFVEPMRNDSISDTRVFLNTVQALETYHSRFVTNSIDDFKSRVESIVNCNGGQPNDETRNFLLANSKSFITLESRLADLLQANWKIWFDTGEITHKDFPSIIAHTRNYYIHYDEKIKEKYRILSNEELPFYNRSLAEILEYYILIQLGFPEGHGETSKKLANRWGNISQDISISNLSKRKLHEQNQ